MKFEAGIWFTDKCDPSRHLPHMEDSAAAFKYLRKRRSVVQAGGHVGTWPKFLAQHFEAVYTFEPDADNWDCLTRNIREHNVYAARATLGHRNGCVDIFKSGNSGGHRVSRDKHRKEAIAGPVPMFKVDDLFLMDCDLIALDVEGFEMPILTGARETLERCRPVVMLEDIGHGAKRGLGDTFADLTKWLGKLGYFEVERVAKDVIFRRVE